jgi:hypothetical protein
MAREEGAIPVPSCPALRLGRLVAHRRERMRARNGLPDQPAHAGARARGLPPRCCRRLRCKDCRAQPTSVHLVDRPDRRGSGYGGGKPATIVP